MLARIAELRKNKNLDNAGADVSASSKLGLDPNCFSMYDVIVEKFVTS